MEEMVVLIVKIISVPFVVIGLFLIGYCVKISLWDQFLEIRELDRICKEQEKELEKKAQHTEPNKKDPRR